MANFKHPYHLVTVSPWPILGSLSLLLLLLGSVKYFHEFSLNLLLIGLFMLFIVLFQWWRDVIRESLFQGFHLNKVLQGLRIGMILFILSELMFFLSFFWAYFHLYLSPSIEIGSYWPPLDMIVFNPYNIPLLNTLLLLSSGFSITWCHYSILNNKYYLSIFSLFLTIILGVIFSLFQYLEYNESYFSMSDSAYGSIFFIATGFHGIHVLIGTLFILISFCRLLSLNYSKFHHFGFEACSWYWHFVDVVWLFLYIFIYWLSY